MTRANCLTMPALPIRYHIHISQQTGGRVSGEPPKDVRPELGAEVILSVKMGPPFSLLDRTTGLGRGLDTAGGVGRAPAMIQACSGVTSDSW